MAIKTGPYLNTKDIYINYSFEDVMFRRECATKLIYKKFYNEAEISAPVPQDNRLYSDALRFGDEITLEEYEKGKVSINE